MKTFNIKCPDCNGEGVHIDPTGNCRNNSNECCGGCDKEYDCETCLGYTDIYVFEDSEHIDKYATIHETVQAWKEIGLSKDECEYLLHEYVKTAISEY
jgi:transcription elongation factor Elf1